MLSQTSTATDQPKRTLIKYIYIPTRLLASRELNGKSHSLQCDEQQTRTKKKEED